jgi:hypothetical protein
MEIGFLSQMKIVDKLLQWSNGFRPIKAGIKLGLASLYLIDHRSQECRRLLEEILAEDPGHDGAKELMQQLRQFN